MHFSVRRTIEHLFELVEANIGAAVVAVVVSFAVTGCLHFFWEATPEDAALYVSKMSAPENNSSGEATFAIRPSSVM